jgi:hypothetical protein
MSSPFAGAQATLQSILARPPNATLMDVNFPEFSSWRTSLDLLTCSRGNRVSSEDRLDWARARAK